MRVVLALVLASALFGCASREVADSGSSTVRTVTRTVVNKVGVCPTDDQLRDAAIEVSKVDYQNRPTGGSKTGACAGDSYVNGGRTVLCGSPEAGAIGVAKGVMYSRNDVPPALVVEMKSKIAACTLTKT